MTKLSLDVTSSGLGVASFSFDVASFNFNDGINTASTLLGRFSIH